MDKIKIGIDAATFEGWGGGVDFIAMIAEALENTGEAQTFLVAESFSPAVMCIDRVRMLLRAKGNIQKYRKQVNEKERNRERLLQTFSICSPSTEPLMYPKTLGRLLCKKEDREKKKLKYLQQCGIEVFLPSANCSATETPIPRLGYIHDFQHKYLSALFDQHECEIRDSNFGRILKNAKYVVVNAQDVKNDIQKHYPDTKSEIIVLPFMPFQKPRLVAQPDLDKYHLPKCYFAVCNQFWMHKSHITAFEALEKLYCEGITDIHLVCTGEMSDIRNPQYIVELKNRIQSMKCCNNIHLLGFIPKDDQIQVMKNAAALIQPTLFEGGPGGGSVYNALCLGVTCLVSDIPVNREISGYDNVYFFGKENAQELSELMRAHHNDKPITESLVDDRIEQNRKEYGKFLLEKINYVIKQERRAI